MSDIQGNRPDIDEKGRDNNGNPISLDARLFMQLLVFSNTSDSEILTETLKTAGIESVLYENVSDPKAVGLLTFHDDPDFFVTKLRKFLNQPPFVNLELLPEYTMFGRTYAQGYETDLNDWLLLKPRRRVLDQDWPWAIWYPLRRSGAFIKLSAQEQKEILREHGTIGFAFGKAGYAQDVRLACHGLDKNDNDFVIGLIGKDLYPLSAVVQTMRKTRQTSEFLMNLGPFFIGKAIWQSPL